MVCIQCVKRSRKNEVRTYHRGPFHRASQSVYCTCGDQWAGVHILAYDCMVEPDRMEIQDPVPVCLAFDRK